MKGLTVDTETTGLMESDRPFMITYVDDDNTSHLIDLRKDQPLAAFIEDYQVSECTFQNAKFDMRMIYNKIGLVPAKVRDLEVLARLVDNSHMSYSLSNIAKRRGLEKLSIVEEYIDKHQLTSKYKDEFREVKRKHFDQVPDDVMYPYATNDAVITKKLYAIELEHLAPESRNLLAVENELTLVCFKMERAGIKIDQEEIDRAIEYEKKKLADANRKFLMINGQVFNNTKDQMVQIFTKEGVEIPKTDKGNLSLDAEALDSFNSPSADIIKEIRHHEKRITTYYSAFKYFALNGIIHPDMRQAGTKTGRFSYRDPNLQNMPKEEESSEPHTIRGCLVPKNDLFVSLDFKQQEYSIMLAYANERKLIRDVMGGADVHQATAELLGLTRKKAKTTNFGILYGLGIEELALALGVSIVEAREIRQMYFGKLPAVDSLIKRIKNTSISRGYIFNWMGRKLTLNDIKHAYAMPNHLIQSSGADTCKVSMVRADTRIKEQGTRIESYPMVLQVHDQLVLDLKQDDLWLVDIIKKEMEESFPEMNGMRLSVDVSYSTKSLAEREMKKWDLG